MQSIYSGAHQMEFDGLLIYYVILYNTSDIVFLLV